MGFAPAAARCMRRTRRCWWSITTCRPRTAASPTPTRRAPTRSRIWRRTPSCSISNTTTSSTSGRAFAMSSAPSRVSPCLGSRSSAATATPPPTARSARWPSASAPPRSSTCSPRKRWCRSSRRICASWSTGKLPPNVTAKDIILAIIGEIGTAGGTGYSLEYAGEAIRALSMEGRMTVCNMSVEAGAKAGFIAPDEKTYEFVKGRPEGAQGQAVGRRAPLLGVAADRRRRAFRPRGQA